MHLQKLTAHTHESKLPSKGNISRLQFHNDDESLVLTLGKKEFSHHEHPHVFAENDGEWVSFIFSKLNVIPTCKRNANSIQFAIVQFNSIY